MFKTSPWGSNTNKNWLKFENQLDFWKSISKINWYDTKDSNIYFKGKKVAEFYKHKKFYKYFLEPKWIKWQWIISKQLLPDTAIYVISWKTVYILEIKSQCWWWSVDEKLQAWKFKKLQYQRLLKPLQLKVEFYFILCDYFLDQKYKDVLNFIRAEWCDYFFWEIPLDYLWLPLE